VLLSAFFPWYNTNIITAGSRLLTPEMLHYGMAGKVIEQRQQVLDEAFARNPNASSTPAQSIRASPLRSGSTRQHQHQRRRQKRCDTKLSRHLSQNSLTRSDHTAAALVRSEQ
jgi:predicted NAD-dependent protein-ADP-ribosyltransferase YbiA (DUF1768 family)